MTGQKKLQRVTCSDRARWPHSQARQDHDPPARTGFCFLAGLSCPCVKPPLSQHLRPWIKSPQGHERARALGLSACLLQHLREHLYISVSTQVPLLLLWLGTLQPLHPGPLQAALPLPAALDSSWTPASPGPSWGGGWRTCRSQESSSGLATRCRV